MRPSDFDWQAMLAGLKPCPFCGERDPVAYMSVPERSVSGKFVNLIGVKCRGCGALMANQSWDKQESRINRLQQAVNDWEKRAHG